MKFVKCLNVALQITKTSILSNGVNHVVPPHNWPITHGLLLSGSCNQIIWASAQFRKVWTIPERWIYFLVSTSFCALSTESKCSLNACRSAGVYGYSFVCFHILVWKPFSPFFLGCSCEKWIRKLKNVRGKNQGVWITKCLLKKSVCQGRVRESILLAVAASGVGESWGKIAEGWWDFLFFTCAHTPNTCLRVRKGISSGQFRFLLLLPVILEGADLWFPEAERKSSCWPKAWGVSAESDPCFKCKPASPFRYISQSHMLKFLNF